MSIPRSRVARTVPQVHDHVEGVQRNSGNCDHREACGTRQKVRDRAGKLCEIKGARRQRQCSGFAVHLPPLCYHQISPSAPNSETPSA